MDVVMIVIDVHLKQMSLILALAFRRYICVEPTPIRLNKTDKYEDLLEARVK